MAEKYTLNWHTFSDHLQLMFKDLFEEEKHSDVTLVCSVMIKLSLKLTRLFSVLAVQF